MEIRELQPADAEAVARLSAELGYAVSAQGMEARMRAREGSPDRIVYVACKDGVVVGWIDVGLVHHLQADAYAEIGGLVVSASYRSGGIGARLVQQAEQWTRDRGLNQVVVRSRVTREAAHRFYLREGYERTKISAVFSKSL